MDIVVRIWAYIYMYTVKELLCYSHLDEPTNGQKRTFIFIAAGIGLLLLVLLLFKSFVLHKRKKLYGGFYLFSEPPTWDYIGKLDISKDIHEQIHKLPFIPEWEFPRDRITFGMYQIKCYYTMQ